MVWQPKQKLNGGKYIIEKVLGEGNLAITYLAFNSSTKARLVIKTLADRHFNDPQFAKLQRKFAQEATKLAQSQHPHVVRVIGQEFTEIEAGKEHICIPLEYVAGVNLGSLPQKILPEAEALRYIRQIGEALIVVHEKGLLHLDIKPENIIVRMGKRKPEAVLIDFGLARELEQPISKHTSSPGFTPLELDPGMKPDRRTDLYSLAATLYLLLTGDKPPDAKERQSQNLAFKAPKELNPKVSTKVSKAVLRGMGLQQNERPDSVREWLDELGLEQRKFPILLLYRDPVLFWTVASAVAGWVAAVGTLIALLK